MNENQEKNRGAFFWLIFGGVVPIIIVGIVAVAIMMMAGVDVGGYIKDKVPILSNTGTTENEKSLESQIALAKETIEEQEEEITDLENEIEDIDQSRDNLEKELKKQEHESEKNQDDETSTNQEEQAGEEETDDLTQAAASFRKMDPQHAAEVLEELSQEKALLILDTLSGDTRGDILEEMEPDKAAVFLDKMVEES